MWAVLAFLALVASLVLVLWLLEKKFPREQSPLATTPGATPHLVLVPVAVTMAPTPKVRAYVCNKDAKPYCGSDGITYRGSCAAQTARRELGITTRSGSCTQQKK